MSIKKITTLKLFTKVSDGCCPQLCDENSVVGSYEGYVPDVFPPQDSGSPHYGDYLILNIDVETGQITNGRKPTQEQLQVLLISEDE